MQCHEFRSEESVFSAGILMRKQQNAIIAFTVWLTIISVFMLRAHKVDYNIFFALCLIGTLVIFQLMHSNYVRPGYLKNIKYFIAAEIVIFGIFVALNVIDIIGWQIVIL